MANAGTIQIDDASNAVGVAIQGGRTGSFSNTGTINVIENYNPADTNSDGVYEAPLASGSGRFGVRATGAAPFIGSISTGGSIFVEGNDSAGVSVESPLQGSILHSGTIGVTGDRSFGLRTTAPVSGEIVTTGSVGAAGQGAVAVSVGGDVGGALKVYSSVLTNAYSTSVRATVADTLKLIQATASEVQQSGSALVVGADVAGGVFLGAPPIGTTTTTTNDDDGDGLADNAEGTGSISNYGSAPAVLVGGAGRSVAIGAFGTGSNAYGLILRGSVGADGLYDGITATGIQVGGTGSPATIAGGIRLTGTIGASAYEAAAVGLRVGAGGVVPEFRNENTLSSQVLSSIVSPATASTATGVLVQAGGVLSTLTNYGAIGAAATGPSVSATAVADQSGTLRSINNQGAITAALMPVATGGVTGGRTIALDLRANTAGVTLTQSVNASPITLASGTTPASPSIVGDVLLGSGPNTVSLQGGTVTGALDLGSGASSLSIGGGAVYTGALSHVGPALAIDVANGSLVNTNASVLQVQTLKVGSTGVLSFAIDPATGRANSYQVAGAATLAAGAKVGVNLLSPVSTAQTYTLITSPALTLGSLASLQAQTPYATIAALRLDAAALKIDLRRRSAAEAGFDAAETAAYDAVFAALPGDTAVQGALFAPTEWAGFIGLYDQMLPDYSAGTFRMASNAARVISRAAAEGGPGGAWVQEITVGARQSASAAGAPFRALGFGIAGGAERQSGLGVLGLRASFLTGDSQNRNAPGLDRSTLTDLGAGLYWRGAWGGLRLDAGGGGGYVRYTFDRQLIVTDADGATTLTRTAAGKAGGWSLNGRIGAAYQADLGRLYIRPQVHLDLFRLSQGAYAETGGGAAFNLAVDRRSGSETSGTASVVMGVDLGGGLNWRPEVELGYRNSFSGDLGATTARFAAGGTSFSIYALGLDTGGAMGRLSLRAGSETFDFSFGAGAEQRGGYLEGDVQVKARLLF